MNTIVLGPQDTGPPLKSVIQQAVAGELQICDESGKVLAYVTSPASREDQLYAAAAANALAEVDLLKRRSQSKVWLTTEELCRSVGMPYHGRSVGVK